MGKSCASPLKDYTNMIEVATFKVAPKKSKAQSISDILRFDIHTPGVMFVDQTLSGACHKCSPEAVHH